jgi:hypothetical protein
MEKIMDNTSKKRIEKQNIFKTVPIEMLIENPNSPNRMSKSSFAKLVRNIERTGLYEPIIVRPLPVTRDPHSDSHAPIDERQVTSYEIINGHYRLKALKQLGYKTVDICVWDVDGKQNDILLATLNRLSGSDILEKKLALLNRLSSHSDSKILSELLPLTSGQIERYRNLKLPCEPAKHDRESFAEPLIIFVNKQQKEIIENAISKIQNADKKSTKRASKTEAFTQLAESFIENTY